MKSKDLLEMGITVSDPNRVDVRGEVTAGNDCNIDKCDFRWRYKTW